MQGRTLLLLASSLGSLAACHSWTHAPGYEQRSTMARTRMPIVTGEACSGWCDVKGPEGRVKLERLETTGAERRESTRFTMRYGTVSAECQGPVTNTGWPFVCAIASAGTSADQWLEVRPGCLSARLTRTPGQSSDEGFELRTDAVKIAGATAPAREISLLRGRDLLVASDAHGGGVDLYTQPGATLSSTTVLALAAYHAFVAIGGLPEACMSGADPVAAR
ncbi:MAG: hypothetical protein HOO96_04265 [Polyangiaceae bacterium]|nr:hypothetical protein [Polyangiaceae bacterium]